MESSNLVKLDNTNVNDLIDLLEKIKNKKRRSAEGYAYLNDVLLKYSIPLPTLWVGDGSIEFLARSRMHLDNEEFFDAIQDISYRKDVQNIRTFGRANEPGQPVFYCSNSYHVARIETSEITRQNIDKDCEFTTTGAWKIQNDLCLVSILTNQEIRGQNVPFDSTSDVFEHMIEQDEVVEAVHKFLDYISKEFTRKSEGYPTDYMLSSAFFNYVINNLSDVDGIMFPSTLYRVEGVNLALKPSSVDEKLKFHSARRAKLQRMNETDYCCTEVLDSKIHNGNGTKICWQV